MDKTTYLQLVNDLDLSKPSKNLLLSLTPVNYIGLAKTLIS